MQMNQGSSSSDMHMMITDTDVDTSLWVLIMANLISSGW